MRLENETGNEAKAVTKQSHPLQLRKQEAAGEVAALNAEGVQEELTFRY